jgi:hypothetical protein
MKRPTRLLMQSLGWQAAWGDRTSSQGNAEAKLACLKGSRLGVKWRLTIAAFHRVQRIPTFEPAEETADSDLQVSALGSAILECEASSALP